jgi:hypothetical protein
MKTYTIYASQTIYFKKTVQAESEEQADDLAFQYDPENDWEEYDYGEWLNEKIEEEV